MERSNNTSIGIRVLCLAITAVGSASISCGCAQRIVEITQTTPNVANKTLPAAFQVPEAATNVSVVVEFRRDQSIFMKFTADPQVRQRWIEKLERHFQCSFSNVNDDDLISVRASLTQGPEWFAPNYNSCLFLRCEKAMQKKWMVIGIDETSNNLYFVCFTL